MAEAAVAEETGAEGNEGAENNESWLDNVSDDHKETFKGFESREKLFETIGYKPPKEEGKDWRESLSEEDKKVASRFTSEADMIRSIKEARKRESLVRVPGKDATDDEKSAYFKAIGVPENPEGYKFETPEGVELTPEMEAENKEWAQVLHKAKVPVETVNILTEHIQKLTEAHQAVLVKADKDFLEQSEAALKDEWKGEEYNKNKTVANQAFREIVNRAGLDMEDLKHMETKEGRIIFDDPRIVKIFAVIGREMGEGSLGPNISEDERDTMQEQLTEIRAKQAEASAKGDSKTANRLYQKEQALIVKMDGNKKIA